MSEQPEGQIREGVRHVEVTADQAGVRLDNFLTKLLSGVPRSRVFRIVRRGEVRVNGKRASPETRLQAGDKVRIPPVSLPSPDAPPPPARVPRTLVESVQESIISETERLIVVNKPAGIAVHGGSGVSFGIIGPYARPAPRRPWSWCIVWIAIPAAVCSSRGIAARSRPCMP